MSNVSADLIWEVSRRQNSYLVKTKTAQFSRDPLNLTNLHSRKAIGISANEKGGVKVITKKPAAANKPASSLSTVTYGGNKSSRKTYRAVANQAAKNGYRPDLRAAAVARASAIRRSQRPVKPEPEPKLRGNAAKKAAAAKHLSTDAIGTPQPLSLLLKLSPLVNELALYDVVNTPGVAADLSHISSNAKTTGYLPANDGAKAAFKDADIIIIPAGIPRKPGMSRDDLFNINAGIVKGLIEVAAEVAPKAFILVISNPVNSTVPISAEVLKAKGVFNAQRLFGVTTLDIVRAETFVAEIAGKSNPQELTVPVIGGHSGETIVPLFSKVTPSVKIPDDKYDALVNRVQFGGDEVVKAKDGAGSATLSMAYAGYRFAEKLLKAAAGVKGLVEPSYVYLPGVPGGKEIAEKTGVDFFSVPIELGPNGAEKAVDIIGDITDKEKKLLDTAVTGLKGNIKKGVDFAHNPPQK
ncbi:lactate/malate dehydrogenase [Corynascus novoguineensis]|uniref:malate dehydrogenase n=1 Tax=Corynascus novoguineensis TaxID=1126955 RepID=A0AAN7D0L6_9PEZI|nr:lactate/malate dehydrogenase [Corynascus novoguineensis]